MELKEIGSMSFQEFLENEYNQLLKNKSQNFVKEIRGKCSQVIKDDGTLNTANPEYSMLKDTFNKLVGFKETEISNIIQGILQSDTFLKVFFNKKLKFTQTKSLKKEMIIKYLSSKQILQFLTPYEVGKNKNPVEAQGLEPLGYKYQDKPLYFYLAPTTQALNHSASKARIRSINQYPINEFHVILDDSLDSDCYNTYSDIISEVQVPLNTVDSLITLIQNTK